MLIEEQLSFHHDGSRTDRGGAVGGPWVRFVFSRDDLRLFGERCGILPIFVSGGGNAQGCAAAM
jgi:hypothetical protein